jgi:hypothetical protein
MTEVDQRSTRLEYALQHVRDAFEAIGRGDASGARASLRVAIPNLGREVSG